MSDPIVVIPPEDGRSCSAFGSTAQFKLEGAHTAGRLCLMLAVTPPGVGPPPHVHQRDDELFIVVEGEISVTGESGTVRAPAGSVVYLPRGTRHTFRNTGTTPSRHWVLTTPSGFDEFYARSAQLFSAKDGLDPQALRALADEYGYEIVPPKP